MRSPLRRPKASDGRYRSEEAGYVIVMVAITSFALILVIGFAIDCGSWYSRAQRLQRAADAAALAAVMAMPDQAAAQTAALDVAAKNGLSDGAQGVTVATTPEPPGRYRVKITDDNVPTYFSSIVFRSISMSRTSHAESLNSLVLGSPYNVFGSGDLNIPGVPNQNFWGAINGFCAAKEQGDFFASAYDGNMGGDTTICPGTETNPDYNAAGYSYIIDIPAQLTDDVSVRIYDAAFAPDVTGPLGLSPDNNGSRPLDPAPTIDTTFRLYDTNGTSDPTDDRLVISTTFVTNDPRTGAIGDWTTLGVIPGGTFPAGRRYKVQVATAPGQIGSTGANAFAIEARRSSNASGCDVRKTAACPRVSGESAMSVFANLASGNSQTVNFWLASIDAAYAGETMKVTLWDAGEGADSMQIIGPDGAALSFSYTTMPDGLGLSGQGTTLDVSGTGLQPGPNRYSDSKFNDRLVTLDVPVPADYASRVASANGNTWWQIRYTLTPDSSLDRTTWGLTVGGEHPVHLIRN